MRAKLLAFAAELAKRGEACALATVVRREPPSSARVGDTALITAGGGYHGWLGGSCTQPTVLHQALRALADGAPRLVALSPDPERDRRAGVTALPMTCYSGGSVDIYIEPQLPAPRLALFGISPVARALASLGTVMGYAVDAVDPDADRIAFPDADQVLTSLDAAPQRPRGARFYAVVATMGQRDEAALASALALEPAYLGLVASRKRFEEIRQLLTGQGIGAAALERIRNPAGLDIGAQTPEEIALSVLAEIVQVRRAASVYREPAEPVAAATAAESAEAIDPICGMTVSTASAAHRAEFGGRTWYFCCAGCRERFLQEPARWAGAPEARGTA